MAQSIPMQPGIGFPPDGQIELLRKLVWNTYLLASAPAGIAWVTPPAASTDPGTAGDVAYDDSFFYICQASGNWLRVPISSW